MEKRSDNKARILKIVGCIMILGVVTMFFGSTYVMFYEPPTYYLEPPYHVGVPREMKMGTYVYDHNRIANYPEYYDDIAKMVDRVLIDITWGSVMKNDSYPNCFDMNKYNFYDEMFQNFSSRGIGIVIQFSPTRGPPAWLDVNLEMDDGRARNPPQDPTERAHFIQMLDYYVNETVNFFDNKSYFIELEYCLADEPYTADWADVMQSMYDTIKASSNATVSIVLNKPELYGSFNSSFDMITIDPYGSDYENVQKIEKAHADVGYSKPVRIIISGMASSQGYDYQRIYRQMVISWFMGGYDFWFWSYNSRWVDNSEEWYVVFFSEDGPVYTERADAIINVRQDLKRFAEIDNYVKTGSNQTLITKLEQIEGQAYSLIMQNNFPAARELLFEAHLMLN